MRNSTNSGLHPRSSGMALIAVLWIVAALSIMVTGLTATVRQQIRVAGAQRDQVTGQALGEAAIALALQEMQANRQPQQGMVAAVVPYAGVDIEVEAAPLSGLISLNGASVDLLAAMLNVAGGLDKGRAEALAATLVKWRDGYPDLDLTDSASARTMPRRFEAPEDLLLVPGVNYDLYARVAPLVSADLRGIDRVNPRAAPLGVLAVLAEGDEARATRYLRQRENNPTGGADASGFPPAFVGGGGGDLYRLRARVPLETGKMLLLTCDVALRASGTAPWRILHTDRQIVASPG